LWGLLAVQLACGRTPAPERPNVLLVTIEAANAFRQVIAAPGEHPREKDAARKLLASLSAQN
jgi:hypothetical protein